MTSGPATPDFSHTFPIHLEVTSPEPYDSPFPVDPGAGVRVEHPVFRGLVSFVRMAQDYSVDRASFNQQLRDIIRG